MRLRLMAGHLSIWVIVAAILFGGFVVATAGQPWLWALALVGILAQMVNEYSLHRFVFHLPAPTRQWQFNLLYRLHYGHHDFPTNLDLIFAPLFLVAPVLVINFAALWAALALAGVDAAFAAAAAVVPLGGGLTFLIYEWFHTTAHVTVRKTAIERRVTTLHGQHHFRDYTKWFHVTAGGEVIDRIMGTAIDRETLKTQQRVEFLRTLGLPPDDPRLLTARATYADRYGLSADEVARAARS